MPISYVNLSPSMPWRISLEKNKTLQHIAAPVLSRLPNWFIRRGIPSITWFSPRVGERLIGWDIPLVFSDKRCYLNMKPSTVCIHTGVGDRHFHGYGVRSHYYSGSPTYLPYSYISCIKFLSSTSSCWHHWIHCLVDVRISTGIGSSDSVHSIE